MSETVMPNSVTEIRNALQGPVPVCVVYPSKRFGQPRPVLTTSELLARLEARGIRNADIARAIGVTPSRVTEMKKGERAIKLDEAARLVATFDLEEGSSPPEQALPVAAARLVVRYLALELGAEVDESSPQIAELAEDVRAFSEFVTDPKVRDSIEAAEAFFQAMRLRRPPLGPATPPETDPALTH